MLVLNHHPRCHQQTQCLKRRQRHETSQVMGREGKCRSGRYLGEHKEMDFEGKDGSEQKDSGHLSSGLAEKQECDEMPGVQDISHGQIRLTAETQGNVTKSNVGTEHDGFPNLASNRRIEGKGDCIEKSVDGR